MKLLVVYYSMYGHVHRLAEAIAEGAERVPGTEVIMCRVPETVPEEVLKQTEAYDAQQAFAHVPICSVEELCNAEAIIFGTPPDLETCAARCVTSSIKPVRCGQREHSWERWEACLRQAPPSMADRNPPS